MRKTIEIKEVDNGFILKGSDPYPSVNIAADYEIIATDIKDLFLHLAEALDADSFELKYEAPEEEEKIVAVSEDEKPPVVVEGWRKIEQHAREVELI